MTIYGVSGASGESNIDGEINSNSISKRHIKERIARSLTPTDIEI